MIPSRVSEYLGHILAAIERIRDYTSCMTEQEFEVDERTHDAVIRNLEVIGEASRLITDSAPAFVAQHPDLPLRQAYRMRNALAHGYFSVNLGVVWRTVQADLPDLADQIRLILAEAE